MSKANVLIVRFDQIQYEEVLVPLKMKLSGAEKIANIVA